MGYRVFAGFAAALVLAAGSAQAADALEGIIAAARAEGGFTGFSAERGAELFRRKGTDWSCTSCHTADPRQPGRHAVTGKPIAPMAPASNPKRLADPAKVEKWFRRNCQDVLARPCSAQEKGDIVAYLRSLAGAAARSVP
jgi:hypothetical protein